MSAKRVQLRASDCGSAFIAATARLIAARSGSLADMPRTERRVTPPPCANEAPLPNIASDDPAAVRNARLCNMSPDPLDDEEVSDAWRQTNCAAAFVSARGYRV